MAAVEAPSADSRTFPSVKAATAVVAVAAAVVAAVVVVV